MKKTLSSILLITCAICAMAEGGIEKHTVTASITYGLEGLKSNFRVVAGGDCHSIFRRGNPFESTGRLSQNVRSGQGTIHDGYLENLDFDFLRSESGLSRYSVDTSQVRQSVSLNNKKEWLESAWNLSMWIVFIAIISVVNKGGSDGLIRVLLMGCLCVPILCQLQDTEKVFGNSTSKIYGLFFTNAEHPNYYLVSANSYQNPNNYWTPTYYYVTKLSSSYSVLWDFYLSYEPKGFTSNSDGSFMVLSLYNGYYRLTKYEPTGVMQWYVVVATSITHVTAMANGGNGFIYLSGYNDYNYSTNYITKINILDGSTAITKDFTSTSTSTSRILYLAVSTVSNVLIFATYQWYNSNGYNYNFTVLDLNSNLGTFNTLMISSYYYIGGIYPVSDGNFYVTGAVYSNNCYNPFVAKYNPSLSEIWRYKIGEGNLKFSASIVTALQTTVNYTYSNESITLQLSQPHNNTQTGTSLLILDPLGNTLAYKNYPNQYAITDRLGPQSVGNYSEGSFAFILRSTNSDNFQYTYLKVFYPFCLPGKYIYGQYSDAYCKSCDSTQFSYLNQTSCYSCSNTSPCPSIQSTCTAGNYFSVYDNACILCPTGNYSNAGSTSCTICPAGYYCPSNSSPVSCPAGTYNSYTGKNDASSCTPCPIGSYSSSPAQISCLPCQTGTYNPNSNATSCTSCPSGTFNNLTGRYYESNCIQCSSGYYSNANSTLCTMCPAGYRCPSTSSHIPCGAGTYSEAGFTICKTCPAGSYNPNTGSSNCTFCSEGTGHNLTGANDSSSCMDCQNNYYSSNLTSGKCLPCPTGSFSLLKASSCFTCSDGQEINLTTNTCINCSAGNYSNYSTSGKCLPCPVGSHSSSNGSSSCTPCSAGTSQNQTGQASCKNCPPGYFASTQGSIQCIQCAQNTFSLTEGATYCSQCSSGYFAPPGSSTCSNCQSNGSPNYCGGCAPGTYVYGTTCANCPVGTYTNSYNQAGCTPCSSGTYQPSAGQSSCIPSPVGYYVSQSGASTRIPCPVGQYQSLTGKSSCESCNIGTFANTTGSTSCKNCSVGNFTNQTGMATCSQCPLGTFANITGLSSCYPCPQGSFSNKSESSNCTLCSIGYYASEIGLTSCAPCPSGTYSTSTGSSSCTNCSAGSISSANMSTCEQCPQGTYLPITQGTSSLNNCIDCPAGKYSNSYGSTSCQQCPIGSFSNNTRSIKCFECPPGTYQDSLGMTNCKHCPVGQFQELSNQTSCNKCPLGTYQNLTGQPSCLFCPSDYYASESLVCLPCSGISSTAGSGTNSEFPSVCLFKGVFRSKEEFIKFTTDNNCSYNSSFNITKPYSPKCRDGIRNLCCFDNNTVKNTECNTLLDLLPGDNSRDKFCDACPFLVPTHCSPDCYGWFSQGSTYGTTFNNQTATNYASCLKSVGNYCSPKLINGDDSECFLFANYCGQSIVKSEYDSSLTKVIITFKKPLPADFGGKRILLFRNLNDMNSNQNGIYLSPSSDYTLTASVEKEVSSLTSYYLDPNSIKDLCDYPMKDSKPYTISSPALTYDKITISYTAYDKCLGFVFWSNITKANSMPIISQYWEVTYADNTGVAADIISRLKTISNYNTANIKISSNDLIIGKILNVKVKATNFMQNVITNSVSVQITKNGTTNGLCGPCQFIDRSICVQLNRICWSDYLNYAVSQFYNTTNCFKAVAPICYKIWKNNKDDTQCDYFRSALNFSLMSTKPAVQSVTYSSSGLSIIIKFSCPIYKDGLMSASNIFADTTLNYLPSSRTIKWTDSSTLEVSYNSQSGVTSSIIFKNSVIKFDYPYSQEYLEKLDYSVKMPELSATITIGGPTKVSAGKTAILYAQFSSSLYALVFKWDVTFDSEALDSTKMKELSKYLASYSTFGSRTSLTLEGSYMVRNLVLKVTLSAKAKSYDSTVITASTTVSVQGDIQKIAFACNGQQIVKYDGSLTSNIPISLDAREYRIPPTISFSVNSGDSADSITTRGDSEIAIEKNITVNYNSRKVVVVGAKFGFEYYKLYKIVATIKSGDTGETNSDSIIVLFNKPSISCIIDNTGYILSLAQDIVLSGEKSKIPEALNDQIDYRWKCSSAISFDGSICTCPVISDSDLSNSKLVISKEKLQNLCKYSFSLTISATRESYTRTAFNETEFVTFTGSVPGLTGKLIKGTSSTINDAYLSIVSDQKNLKYSWTLVEIQSYNPYDTKYYSQKKTFIYNFLMNQLKLNVLENMKSEDTEIPKEYYPALITATDSKMLGFNKDSLLPQCKYTFGVIVRSQNGPSCQFVSFVTQPEARPRIVSVTPTSGTSMETTFTIKFGLDSTTENDEAQYQIFRRDCANNSTSIVPLTQRFDKSNTFEVTLGQGKKACDYQVEIIVRTYEYDGFKDNSSIITVNPSTSAADELVKKELDKLLGNDSSLSASQKFSMIASLSNIEVAETSASGKKFVDQIFTAMFDLDKADGGVYDLTDDKDKPGYMITLSTTMGTLTSKYASNINSELANSMVSKLDEFMDRAKSLDKGSSILASSFETLDKISDMAKNQKANNSFFSSVKNVTSKMSNIKLNEMVSGSLPYELSSSTIALTLSKNSIADFNASKNLTTNNSGFCMQMPSMQSGMIQVLKNKTTNSASNPSITKASPSSTSSDTIDESSLVLSAQVETSSFNPMKPVRTNTVINKKSFSDSSSSRVTPELISSTYSDLAKGKLNGIVDTEEQSAAIASVQLNAYAEQPDSSEVPLNKTINFVAAPRAEPLKFRLSSSKIASSTLSSKNQDPVLVPTYYDNDNKTWTNENCSAVLENNTGVIQVECGQMKASSSSDPALAPFLITVDILTDVLNVIIAGNYKQLADIGELAKVSERTGIAFAVLLGTITLVIVCELVLWRIDKRDNVSMKLKMLKERFEKTEKIVIATGFLKQVFEFFSERRKKGIEGVAKLNQGKVGTERVDTEKKMVKKALRANGLNILSVNDANEIKDAYALYKQCELFFEKEELIEVMSEQFESSKIVTRLTQEYIEDEMLRENATIWVLIKLENPIVSLITKPDIGTPRTVKFLVLMCVLLGELFLNGFFYGVSSATDGAVEDMIYTFIISVIASTTLMIPLKIVIAMFLNGNMLSEDMTREEIEKAEGRLPKFRIIGYILTALWLGGCMYGTLMYIVTFNQLDLENWASIYFVSFFLEIIVMSQLKVALKVLVGYILLKCTKSPLLLGTVGQCLSLMIDFGAQFL